ncbi:hypothetical protein [Pseudoclavibacter sp. 13-3]|uniref:hypothetical protein n=1 Tax=Pseudoclavibacter sp. 13-3 TaxID=2901228 RepID=UPI001E3F841B|nr:hypothetical protein [Pseudoclavibacter sp. 13-3]MCD7100451.1 hypothetical protein [Pseudoclavibacter sp. 13-3]
MIPDTVMPEPAGMVGERLRALLPGVFVAPERTANMPIPAVLYDCSSSGQVLNAPTGWTVDLGVTVLAPAEQVEDLVKTVYAGVRSWKGTSSPHGHVVTVTDTQLPELQDQSSTAGKPVVAYRGSWRLLCRTITN